MGFELVLFGLGVGILVGATGMGGGSIMTPLLILALGVKPTVAIGTDIAYAAVTKTVGGWRHLKARSVDLGIVAWLAVGSIPGALAGTWALGIVERALGAEFETTIMVALAITLFLTAGAVLWFALGRKPVDEREEFTFSWSSRAGTVAFGLVIGMVLGVTSAGSGSLIAVGLIMAYRLSPLRVVGTDVAHAAVLLWFAAGAHALAGNVDYAMAGTILIGSVPGAWLGAGLARRLPAEALRLLLGVVLVAAGLGLLSKAGIGAMPPGMIVAIPLALGAAVGGFILARGRAAQRHRGAGI